GLLHHLRFTAFNGSNSDVSYLRNTLKSYSQTKLLSGRSCDSLDITVHIRHGSLPIVNINNASLPDKWISDEFQQYSFQMKSDSGLIPFNLTNPLPGDWFCLSYLNKVDDRISQKGLEAECQHRLTASLSFFTFSQLYPNNDITVLSTANSLVQNITHTTFYKFYLNANCFSAKLVISDCAQISPVPIESKPICPVDVFVRSMALPTRTLNDYRINCKNQLFNCSVEMNSIASGSWIYLQIEPFSYLEVVSAKLNLTIDQTDNCFKIPNEEALESMPKPMTALTYSSRFTSNQTKPLENKEPLEPPKTLSPNYISLTRYDSLNSLEFKYSHVDATSLSPNQSVSIFIDIPSNRSSVLEIRSVSIFIDIPSNRSSVLEIGIIPLSDIGGTLSIDFAINPLTNTTQQNYTVNLCLQHMRVGFGSDCFYEIDVNTTDKQFHEKRGLETVLIPFPRPGNWFITLTPRCYYSDEDSDTIMECLENKTSVLLDIISSPCLHSKCGPHGKCQQYFSGGVLFSSCVCRGGWKGWFCNDGSQAIPEDQLLLNFLLLTLSNIMFIPAVVLSAYRKHFTEALVYLTTMTSSTLYHACDSDYPQSYCMLNVNVLQFGDFYSAILAFWVTLVTLANMPDLCRAFFHLFGALLIAFAVESDRTSLWAFALPAGIGAAILIISWVVRCCRKGCYPTRRLWIFSILPGIALSAGGLVVYAFFETQDNYAITHSCWHAIMALALLFLVPSMKSGTPDEEVGGKGSDTETYYELIGEEGSHLARVTPR
ncbi:unnamed protein product, partial [Medioppia subpectinata]